MESKYLKTLVLFIVFSLILSFSFLGCDIQPQVEETVAEEPEEVMEEDMNEPDPFIAGHMEGLEEHYSGMKLDWKGPDGETPMKGNELMLTKAEVKAIQDGDYTYAIIENNLAGEYSIAVNQATQDLYEYLGMEQVAFTSAEFDPAKQKTDVETVLALNPDLVIGHPTDPVTSAESFQPIVDAGIPMAMYDTKPQGYEYGREMVGLSVNDGFEEGVMMADEMNRLLGDDGKVGYVFYDDVYYICNMIDQSFIDALESRHPTMEVVEKTGWVAEDEAGDVAAAIIQKHPDVEGLFTTYMVPAMYMVGACQEAGRDDIVVVTFGIDMPVLLNLIEGGNVKSLTTDMPYYLGFNAAMLGAYGLLDKEVPGSGYVVMPNMAITVDNVREVWDLAMKIPFPEELDEALKKIGK